MTIAVYAPSLSYGYVYEDVARVDFRAWHGWRAWLDLVVQVPARSGTRALWDWLGHQTAYEAWWQHLASLSVHLVNGGLLWGLARRLRYTLVATAVTVGVFLLHPLQMEAVAYVGSRSELLTTTSVLLALWAIEAGWTPLAFLLACSAVMGKQAGLMALILVPMWASWRRLPGWSAARLGWWAACGLLVLAGLQASQRPTMRLLPLAEMQQTLAAWTWLLGQWVVPVGQTIDPDWALRTAGWSGLILPVWCLALVSSRGWLRFGLLWALLVVAPRLVWDIGEGLHEHHFLLMTPVIALGTGYLVGGRTHGR